MQQEERVIGVTIASVRFYFRPNSVQREKSLSFKLWGFAEWFEYRLKPIREELRGPEVKGVNIERQHPGRSGHPQLDCSAVFTLMNNP